MNLTLILSVLAIFLLLIYLTFFIININKKKDELDANTVIDQMFEGKSRSGMFMFNLERKLLDFFNLEGSKTRPFLYAIRILAIIIVVLLFNFFGAFGLIIPSAIIIYFMMKDKADRKVYEAGVSRVDDTISFIDFFSPRIAAGTSAKKAMNEYIEKIDADSREKSLFIEYMNAKESNDYTYEKPLEIAEITNIYEMALYNEDKGVDDYIYILEEVRTDLQTKLGYWRDYQNRCAEVLKPINIAYMGGIPIICVIMLPIFGDFWYTPIGIATAIVVVLLFMLFQFLINHLSISTLDKVL